MKDETPAALRSAALLALLFGTIGSIGLLRRAQQHPPLFLAVLFVVWVSAPFCLLGIASLFSKRWPIGVRKTFYIVTLFITVASLAIYVDDNVAHRTAHPAAVWVAVPPASVIVAAVIVGIAALRRKR